jgi:Flp pilus assembly protein TadD
MRKVILVSIGLFAGWLMTACTAAPAPNAPETEPVVAAPVAAVSLAQEIEALKAGDTARAIDGVKKILSAAPDSAEAHLLLGQAYLRDNRKADAEKEFAAGFSLDKAAELPLETQNADEVFLAGNAHATLGQLDEALAAYQETLKLNPNKGGAYTNIGVVYYQKGDLEEAIKQLKKALEVDPQDAETTYMLGAAYVQKQDLIEAEKAFNRALELNPDLAPAHTGLGNVYLLSKKFDQAVTVLQKATQLQPDSPEAWLALGQAYAALNKKAEASGALNQCVQFSQAEPRQALRARCEQILQQVGTP